MPPTSAANHVGFHQIPHKPELTGLTHLEARLVSARIPFMWIKTKPGSGMKCIKGTMTCVPADVPTTVEALPRNVTEADVVHVELKKFKYEDCNSMFLDLQYFRFVSIWIGQCCKTSPKTSK